MHKNRAIGFCSVLVGIVIAVYAMTIQTRIELTEPGPRAFPLIAGLGIAVCGIGILATEFHKVEDKPFLDKAGWKRYGMSAGILVCYCLLMGLFGFVLSTPLAILAFSRLFSQKKYNWLIGVLVSAVSTGLIYYIFTVVFHLPLPSGMLF